MEHVGPDGKIAQFSRSNDPRVGKPPYFANFRTSVKTLVMEPVGPNRQTGPFSMSNEPRAGKPLFCQFTCTMVLGFLVIHNSCLFFDEIFMDVH
ncbi:hypothetical protein H5410_042226 [Solanum commersonii]|uniref:Uncharacterized protein n=1 Tax=Solanum commersonii TaxID=4109 RepID=A0A9J5XWW7_SOLCO|nr:hypothetical protein H5410_042226 [Solanum commersonii]